jgi:hypothetical protein
MNKQKENNYKTTRVSVNHTRFPKVILLPDWARRDKQSTKDDRVECQWRRLVQPMYI